MRHLNSYIAYGFSALSLLPGQAAIGVDVDLHE